MCSDAFLIMVDLIKKWKEKKKKNQRNLRVRFYFFAPNTIIFANVNVRVVKYLFAKSPAQEK